MHLQSSLIGNPKNGQNYTVTVFDEAGREICWCGPYDQRDRDKCVDMFTAAGWQGLVNTH